MIVQRLVCLAMALCLFSSAASCSGNAFEANFTAAQENAKTKTGAAYDMALGNGLQSPDVQAQISKCLKDNPGPQAVRGFFQFSTPSRYRLMLRPESRFSRCLSRAMEGHRVPAPPRLPYLNPFNFTSQP